MNGPLALELRGVSKRYPHFRLDGIDIAVPTGTIMTICIGIAAAFWLQSRKTQLV